MVKDMKIYFDIQVKNNHLEVTELQVPIETTWKKVANNVILIKVENIRNDEIEFFYHFTDNF